MKHMLNSKNRLLGCSHRTGKGMSIVLSVFITLFFILDSNAQNQGSFISFDFSKENGKIKPLNGVNIGTDLDRGVFTDYMTQTYADLKIPYTRLHDCHYPHADVVDIPAIFPLFHLDADDPSNYNFKKTDDYILELLKSGSKPYYRLGVSIEHSKVKYFIHPPEDYDKWAKICVNIIRHYNEGWANGFHFNIKYWEIWNEPDVDVLWSGTHEQYFKLYETAVKAIKKHDPDIMVGNGGVESVDNIGKAFIAYCKAHQLPLDFFAWHRYTTDPEEVINTANKVRKLLDENGYAKTESHLNEWNYWPGNWQVLYNRYSWKDIATTEMKSAKSAVYVTTTLINLQDASVDQACFYAGGMWDIFGLFDRYGIPKKSFYSFKAMAMLLDAPNRVVCKKDSIYEGISVIGGLNNSENAAVIMISNYNSKQNTANIRITNLPWENATNVEVFVIDDENNLNLSPRFRTINEKSFTLEEKLSSPITKVIRLTPSIKKF